MDLSVKNDCTAVQHEGDGFLLDADALKFELAELEAALPEKIIAGDVEGIINTRELIRTFPPRIFAAEVRDTTAKINETNRRLAELKIETQILELERKKRNIALGEKMLELEPFQMAVAEVDLVLYRTDSEAVTLRERRRDLKEKLDGFLATVRAENGETNNERYN
jgi:hypothetical protein